MTSHRPSIMLIGHSHIMALHTGFSECQRNDDARISNNIIQLFGRDEEFVVGEDGAFSPDGGLAGELQDNIQASKPDLVLFPLYGAEYFVTCFPLTDRQFDLIIPNQPLQPIENGVEIIPYHAFCEIALSHYRRYIGLVSSIGQRSGCRTAYVLPPPPTHDSDFILKQLQAPGPAEEKHFKSVRPRQLLNSWLAYANVAEEICRTMNIEIVRPPRQALTPQGFLAREYAEDALHANSRYGALVFGEVAAHFFPDLPVAQVLQ